MKTINGKTVERAAVTGDMLRDQGILAVVAADTAPHRRAAPAIREAVEAFAAAGERFTAEDVREALRDNEHAVREMRSRPNLLPAVMRDAARKAGARVVDWTEASRPEAHGRGLRVWQGAA